MSRSQRRDPLLPIEVVDISSTGLPARHPRVNEQQSRGYLRKAATKIADAGDLLRVAEDMLSCGWPDISVRYRYRDASENEVREWTLVRQQHHEDQSGAARPEAS